MRGALADLLDAYRQYFLAVAGDDTRVRSEVRALSRRARSNAQASLDRLRGEPWRRDLVATVEGVFANANRFLRAAMALEAMRQSAAPLSDRKAVETFAASVDAATNSLARVLRYGDIPATGNAVRE